MRLTFACSSVNTLVYEIQQLDPQYQAFGKAYPFQDGWAWWLFDFINAKTGRYTYPFPKNPDKGLMENNLLDRLLAPLEARACRRTYQQVAQTLEKLLDKALPEYGEEKIASFAAHFYVERYGHEFVPRMQKAGFVFSDPQRLDRLFKKGQEIARRLELEKRLPAPVNRAVIRFRPRG
jgi:hypothetical protein